MGLGNRPPVNEETYIRQLPFSVVKYVSTLLDIDRKWERLVVRIPKRLNDLEREDSERRYSHLQIRMFEDKSKRPDGSPTKSILEDWGTQNTKTKHLIRILQETALYEAADYISVNVLHAGKVPRLHENPPSNNTGELPTPQWEPQKQKEPQYPPQQVENFALCQSNFDNFTDKKMYDKDKFIGDDNQKASTYSSLMNGKREDGTYNKLSPGGPADGQVIYNRITSFDSGGLPSVSLRDDNLTETKGGEEHAEETLQIRTFKDDQQKDVQFVQKKREPCETSDDVPDTNSQVDDLYAQISSKKIDFQMLQLITDNFNRNPLCQGGRVIGSGGFGEVYLGLCGNGYKVAVKRLKDVDEVEKQFATELDSLMKYRHNNIVRLFGYSISSAGKCLVYEYLCNGSLEDRLVRKDNTPPLPNNVRISILQGTAKGINFLNQQGIVHRDIKSANVLLDETFQPKVGDFATVRGGPRGTGMTMDMSTSVVIGTSAYLAPEAFNFDVSTKLDSYSFGVVILEVLTSLPALDQTRAEKDLISYVEEHQVEKLLDTSGGPWCKIAVETLMSMSEKCAKKKKQRANISDILDDLLSLSC